MRSVQLNVMLVLSVCALSITAQHLSNSRFWGLIFDEFSGDTEENASQEYQARAPGEYYSPVTAPTTARAPAISHAPTESLASKKEEFLAADDEGKVALLQRVLASRPAQQVPATPGQAGHPATVPSAQSPADRKAAFLALGNEAKIDFLQQALAAKGGQQTQGVSFDSGLTPTQRKDAFLKLPTAAKIAYLRNIASGTKSF